MARVAAQGGVDHGYLSDCHRFHRGPDPRAHPAAGRPGNPPLLHDGGQDLSQHPRRRRDDRPGILRQAPGRGHVHHHPNQLGGVPAGVHAPAGSRPGRAVHRLFLGPQRHLPKRPAGPGGAAKALPPAEDGGVRFPVRLHGGGAAGVLRRQAPPGGQKPGGGPGLAPRECAAPVPLVHRG